jgi:tryptophan synthase beta subunit
MKLPDGSGHFTANGVGYGGRFAPEALTAALDELTAAYQQATSDPSFRAELDGLLKGYAGRPTMLTEVKRFGQQAGGATVLLKREDLTHTGSHKINNVLGQVLLARRMGKTRVIAETGAGQHTHYCIGSVGGPHPFPMMVRDFQRVIGQEAREQVLSQQGRLPDVVIACVGGGSNAIGLFDAFIPDPQVRLIGCEAGGDGIETGRHAATLTGGSPGILHGMRTYVLQDDEGQTRSTHSISAGLDYPGVGPEHVWLMETGRASYRAVTDAEAMHAFDVLCRTEGIIPAIESAHALAGALDVGRELGPGALIVVNLSGRGDKDVDTASKWFGV